MWRVLVAGGGPAGLYVCRNLLNLPLKMHIDLYEKSQSLYGLLCTGVSPDKLSLKSLIPSFDSTLSNPNIRVHLGQKVGEMISASEIAMNYDFMILCTGATVPRNIIISGESNGRVFQALDFCNYYNGFGSRNAEDIMRCLGNNNATHATVIGNGNVALDIAKMLLYPRRSLEHTLMSKHIINTLPQLEKVYIVGRGGWINAKFTNAQLGSIVNSDLFHPVISPANYEKSINLHSGLLSMANTTSGRAIERRRKIVERMAKNYHINGKRILEFIFHSNVTKISQGTAKMDIQISNCAEHPINVESNVIFKALGFERDQLTLDLLSRENAEIFKANCCHFASVGWSKFGAKGDLSTTILQAKECAEFVNHITSLFKPKSGI